MKWMALPATQELIKRLMNDTKIGPQVLANQTLNAFITSPKLVLQNSALLNSTMKSNPHTPPRSPCN